MSKNTPLVIGGIAYKVELVDRLKDVDIDGEAKELFGQISFHRRVIRLYADPNSDAFLETMLHEIVHGVCDASGITLTEEQIKPFSRCLYDTLSRNGLLADITVVSGSTTVANKKHQ